MTIKNFFNKKKEIENNEQMIPIKVDQTPL